VEGLGGSQRAKRTCYADLSRGEMKVSREGALVLDASSGRSEQGGRVQGWLKSNREVRDAKEEYSTVDSSPHGREANVAS
jgi:hypothetical protein